MSSLRVKVHVTFQMALILNWLNLIKIFIDALLNSCSLKSHVHPGEEFSGSYRCCHEIS